MSANEASPGSINAPAVVKQGIAQQGPRRVAIHDAADVYRTTILSGSSNGDSDESKSLAASKRQAVVQRLGDFGARDPQEKMLAVQFMVLHDAFIECMARASRVGTFELSDSYLGQAVKLSSQSIKLGEALDKHRGKGQQKVTVEHVHVESGGQAVVGSVHTRAPVLEAPQLKPIPPTMATERPQLHSRRVAACHSA